ncbi:hypothetical protein ACVWW5_008495 [Bradyrhizobium sp. LM3.4]
MEHEVIEVDKFAVKPQSGASVGEVHSADRTVTDWAFGQSLVEAGDSILGRGKRPRELSPRQWIGDFVAGRQGLDNLKRKRRNGT